MPVTFQQAHSIATEELSRSDAIRITEAREFDVGWVFLYQSTIYLEGDDPSQALAGNAPLFVARSDGRTFYVTYHRPLVESLAAYRACGNPNAILLPEVKLSGWEFGASVVEAIMLVRAGSSGGLADAKAAIERCLANQPATVVTSDVERAKRLVRELGSVGFKAEVRYDG
jgi:hypothetical protein